MRAEQCLLALAAVVVSVNSQGDNGGVGAASSDATKLSWKERARLDYQRRYNKYVLHKVAADDSENAIGGSLSDTRSEAAQPPANAINTRFGGGDAIPPAPAAVPVSPVTSAPTTTPRPTTTFRTTTMARPTTPVRAPPTRPTAPRPPSPPTTTTRRPAPAVNFAATGSAPVASLVGTRASSLDSGASSPNPGFSSVVTNPNSIPETQQSTTSGFFQGQNGAVATGFANSTATAFSSEGRIGGTTASFSGTVNTAGIAQGTFSVSSGGAAGASASATSAAGSSSASATTGGGLPLKKSPVALLGQVVQGIVRPITSILPAPLGPKGSNPGIVGGLVTGIFDELDGSLRAIYPGAVRALRTQRGRRVPRSYYPRPRSAEAANAANGYQLRGSYSPKA